MWKKRNTKYYKKKKKNHIHTVENIELCFYFEYYEKMPCSWFDVKNSNIRVIKAPYSGVYLFLFALWKFSSTLNVSKRWVARELNWEMRELVGIRKKKKTKIRLDFFSDMLWNVYYYIYLY